MKKMLHLFTACPATAGKNLLSTCFSTVFLLSVLFGNNTCLFSQTTWDGSTNSNWNTSDNWSAGVPDANDDVTIPDVATDPIISVAGALAKSVTVNTNGVLTINADGTLSIDGATAGSPSIINNGTVDNSKTINIGATTSAGNWGIRNEGTFNNNTGGTINIDRSTEFGIRTFGGTFTNQATLNIGATASAGNTGIYMSGGTFNNTGGTINIDRSTVIGISNQSGTFTNSATLNIGAIASVGSYGIFNSATFNNNTGGAIHIDRSTVSGINYNAGTFTNSATITLGELVAMTDLIASSSGTFSNSTGGTLNGTGNISATVFTNAGGTLSPGYSAGIMTFTLSEDFSSSIMSIEVNGKTLPGADFDQVVVTGTATLGGTLALTVSFPGALSGDQVPILTATTRSGEFGTVTGLPAMWYVNYTSTSVILSFGAPLPVELADFTARLFGKGMQLDWRTASELNNEGFYVERSTDGIRWEEIGFVAGNGTTTQAQAYKFLDEKPLPGVNYYRLRQVDFDGKEEFSEVVAIDLSALQVLTGLRLRAFPNPVSEGELTLLLLDDLDEKVPMQLFDPAGRLVRSAWLDKGANSLDVSNLAAGIYTLRAGRFFEKIVVQR